jgi:aminobenzoyl-glutamate utilization protein B
MFEAAGAAPTIVPSDTRLWLKPRDADRPRTNVMPAWIRQIAEGAAMATQTRANGIPYRRKATRIEARGRRA